MKKNYLIIFICFLFTTQTIFASNANWMSQIPNDRVLNQLIIPGTHNSGTNEITGKSLFSLSKDSPLPIWIEIISNIFPHSIVRIITARWSKTQPYSIFQQLNDGIRYLDLRVCRYQSHFYLCHALLSERLEKALHQIALFAKAHPSEIILVDINHIYGVHSSAAKTQLSNIIQQYLGNDLIPNHYHVTDTMGTLRASNRSVIVFMNAADDVSHSFWRESEINSPWPNVHRVTDLFQALNTEVAYRAKTVATSQHVFVYQAIQTESNNQVIRGILYPHLFAHNIKRYEMPVNAMLLNWITSTIAEYGIASINVVMQDWYQPHQGLVQLAIAYDSQPLPIIIKKSTSPKLITALKKYASACMINKNCVD